MQVRAIKEYFDKELNRLVKVTDPPFEVTAARGKALTSTNNAAGVVVCEEVTTPTPEKVVKKPRAKKEA